MENNLHFSLCSPHPTRRAYARSLPPPYGYELFSVSLPTRAPPYYAGPIMLAPPRRARREKRARGLALQPSGHHGHPHRALGPARLRVLPTWRAQGLGVPLRPALAARAPRLLARCPPTQASTRRLAANIAAGRRSRGARGGADATRAVCSDAPSHFASEVRTGRAFNGELVLGC